MNQFPDIPSDIKKQPAFTCAYEKDRIPSRDPEADQLYRNARWLIKANTLRQVPEAYPPIERLLRIATAHGHDRANVELRHMSDKGRAQSNDPVNETIDMVQDLIKRAPRRFLWNKGENRWQSSPVGKWTSRSRRSRL